MTLIIGRVMYVSVGFFLGESNCAPYTTDQSPEEEACKILQVNSQSLLSKLDRLRVLVATERPTVICIQEHWFTETNCCLLLLGGYRLADIYCRRDRTRGGSLILVKDDHRIVTKKLDFAARESVESDFECCAVQFQTDCFHCCIVSIYRSPTGSLDVFFEKLNNVVVYCQKMAVRVFICGDFNIDFLNNSSDKQSLCDFMQNFNLVCISKEPTRICVNRHGRETSTKIDYILSNVGNLSMSEKVTQPNLGDHLALVHIFRLHIHDVATGGQWFTLRDISDFNLQKLYYCVKDINFKCLERYDSVDAAYDKFIELITSAVDKNCPIITKRSEHERMNGKEWVNAAVIEAGERLRNMFWAVKHDSGELACQRYKAAKKEYKDLINTTKWRYYSQIIELSSNKSKKVWSIVNKHTGRLKSRSTDITLNVEGEVITERGEIADRFAGYFSGAAAQRIQESFGSDISTSCTTMAINHGSFFFWPVDDAEVGQVIKSLKDSNSVGPDRINTKLLKSVADSISQPLALLINMSVSKGIFPSLLKVASVVPVHKKNDHTCLSNYRPISVLNVTSKIIERVVYNRMVSFLVKHALLTERQHGFWAGRSTESAAYSFLGHVYEKVDQGYFVAGLFFDLTAAFDSLNINFACDKLYAVGFRGPILSWIKSYLSHRQIFVSLDGIKSAEYEMNMGVPQGSVLGPLIFLLFINDLPSSLGTGFLSMFADDAAVAVSARTPGELEELLQQTVSQFSEWCHRNSLILNLSKTVLMRFACQKASLANISCDNIDNRVSTKFLGIFLDETLNWEAHIEHVSKKVNQAYYAISQLKNMLDRKHLINVYYALVYCHLCYNVILWGGGVTSGRVFVAQKKVMRLIFGLKYRDTCKGYFLDNKIMTFPCVYIYKCLLATKTFLGDFACNGDCHEYNTRNRTGLAVAAHSTSKFEKSPSYSGAKLYNKLPMSVRQLSYKPFKRALKSFLVQKAYYSVAEYLEDGCD